MLQMPRHMANWGINEDAFQLYSTWNFNDPDKFNIPVMQQLVRLKPARPFTFDTLKSYIKTMPGILRNTYTFFVCLHYDRPLAYMGENAERKNCSA